MNAQVDIRLTDRQRDVLERIDRRVPIKVIAGDLGVSEARINQHIRALKDKFEVESMSDLVEQFRLHFDPEDIVKTDDCADSESAIGLGRDPYRNPQYRNSQLHDVPIFPDQGHRADPGEIVLSDAHHVLIDAPWMGSREPVVVPTKFDGDYAVLVRLAAMIGIAFGIVAAVILVASAAKTVTEVLDGIAELRTEGTGS
ncbi:MAG: LuxR C-terminal-related transcriptional regulator [Pontixanthobacter sp.]